MLLLPLPVWPQVIDFDDMSYIAPLSDCVLSSGYRGILAWVDSTHNLDSTLARGCNSCHNGSDLQRKCDFGRVGGPFMIIHWCR